MGRFSEVLLLVSFTLLPSLFVNGDPTSGFSSSSSFKPTKRNASIRGLLVARQGVCDPGFIGCEATGCCPLAWNCCIDSNCCQPNTYCALASNGIIGCCDDGKICSGPVGGPTTIDGPPPPTPTIPAPAPLPTTPTVPVPVVPTTTTKVPVAPTTTAINTVPAATTQAPNVQSTVNNLPTTTATTSSKSGGLPLLNAAGQAQLSRPLLVFAGILVAAMY